jgi:Lon protease-like protein
MPIFVCTLAFPYMPTFLHIFEPRYKLMIRRCVESGDGRFGIVLPSLPTASQSVGEAQGCPSATYGTVLRINSVQYLEDGRSLLETTGEDRFRLERWGSRDGYMVGRVELLPDDGTDGDSEEELDSSLFAASDLGFQLSPQDDALDVQGLLQEATHFIRKLRQGSAPWVLQHLEITHGEVPDDPSVFAFWVASLIPVHEEEKYLLLKARGVRTRLRIVLHWVRKLQNQLWFHGTCAVM